MQIQPATYGGTINFTKAQPDTTSSRDKTLRPMEPTPINISHPSGLKTSCSPSNVSSFIIRQSSTCSAIQTSNHSRQGRVAGLFSSTHDSRCFVSPSLASVSVEVSTRGRLDPSCCRFDDRKLGCRESRSMMLWHILGFELFFLLWFVW